MVARDRRSTYLIAAFRPLDDQAQEDAGKRLLAAQNATAEREDRRLMRFNNSIALILLGLAQVAFVLGAPQAGWVLAGLVAVAAAVALAGFCLGCYLYYQFKLYRYRLGRFQF